MSHKSGKNESFVSKNSKFDGTLHPYSLPYTAPQPVGGYDRVLGSRLRRNGDRRKQMIIVRRNFVNYKRREWERAPIEAVSKALERSRRTRIKGLLIFAIRMILHTCTHPSTRAELLDPKKAFLGPQKGLTSLEKMEVSVVKTRSSMERCVRIVLRA